MKLYISHAQKLTHIAFRIKEMQRWARTSKEMIALTPEDLPGTREMYKWHYECEMRCVRRFQEIYINTCLNFVTYED